MAGRSRIAIGCRSHATVYRIADFLAVRASFIWPRSFRRAGQHAHTCHSALPDSFGAARGLAPAPSLSHRHARSDRRWRDRHGPHAASRQEPDDPAGRFVTML
ncbi:hypothetical protein WS66_06965 [Burkholderia sp. LA-2-3-30-S1-D2]|nr:hypothetical protein WS66_06965 [Burkholderia sp. LA-2-3-30-S1-D2]